MRIDHYIEHFSECFERQINLLPWEITADIRAILEDIILQLDDNYVINDFIAIHKSAVVENAVVLKAPVIVGQGCFIGANAYLRGGVYLGKGSKIGTGCEVKSSLIFDSTNVAHFNFIGDSIIGCNVNFEAGSITANHYNERSDKNILVVYQSEIIESGVGKFGALVGDHSKIGANAVLSPGTILDKYSVVKRLELIDQVDKFLTDK